MDVVESSLPGEGYPPLVPLVPEPTWQEKMAKQMAEVEKRMVKVEKVLENHKELHKTQLELLFGFCERDVLILVGEILKWAVKKCGENDEEGRQLFDTDSDVECMVLLCCRAYGEFGPNPNKRHVKDFKEMSQLVIKARNNTVHFQDLEALERMVKSCEIAIKQWLVLATKYPSQVKVIGKYKAFKQHLLRVFHLNPFKVQR